MSKGKGDDSRVEHDWDMSHKKKMSIEDEGDIPEFMAPVVDFSESERYVEGLKKFSTVSEPFKGEELKGKQYTPPFAYFESRRATGAFRAPASHPQGEEQ